MTKRSKLRVLLVDDDEAFRRIFGTALAEDGFSIETAGDGLAALELMQRKSFDLALVDLRMNGMDGLSLLAELKRRHPNVLPLVLTGFGAVPTTVEAMRRGAFDVLAKSAPVEQIVAALDRAAEHRRESREGTGLEEAVFDHSSYYGIVGKSPAIREVFRAIDRFQQSDRSVMVCGESGTGKELVARAIHTGSRRAKRPLVSVNCASLRENFVENELFGHVRGAFTGAIAPKPGLFALADGGTLLIDEVGEMPEGAQAALLRVLETGRYRPLGGLEEVSVDVRVIASTNRDIDQMIEDGRFRADLFYRLCVCRIDMPPLRERTGDIPLLLSYFLDSAAAARAGGVRVDADLLGTLEAHDWPGNVRELLNTLERAAIVAEEGLVTSANLRLRSRAAPVSRAKPTPEPVAASPSEPPPASSPAMVDTEAAIRRGSAPTLEELERSYIRELWQRTGGNIAEIGRILDVDPTTIRRKLRRWGDRT